MNKTDKLPLNKEECPKSLRDIEIERAYQELAEKRDAEIRWQTEVMEKMASQEFLVWERFKMVPGLG